MSASDPEFLERYERFDSSALSSTLLNTDAGPEAHRAALTALSHRGPLERNPLLVRILGTILKNTSRWEPDIPEKIIDLFATDPDPEATVAMLEVLPILLGQERAVGTTSALSTVRGYFYQALATREREEDVVVWSEFLPTLSAHMLANIVLDPQAGPLIDAIDPLVLISRKPEPDRTNAIFSIIVGATRGGEVTEEVRQAWLMLKEGAQRQAYFDGIETLAEQWEMARQAGRSQHMKGLETVLAKMDTKPRSPSERLTGKRPWAP
jgi:hypothetical protein